MKLNIITYAPFLLLVYKFKSNFINKCFTNNVIDQIINQFCFKSKFNYTPHKYVLAELDETRLMMQIFFDLKGPI